MLLWYLIVSETTSVQGVINVIEPLDDLNIENIEVEHGVQVSRENR